MPKPTDVNVIDIVKDVVDNEPVEKGQDVKLPEDNKPEPKKTEIKFDELDDNMKKFIDQERTKASRTARDKAMREAVDNPEIVKAITERITREQKMSLDEKLTEREKAVSIKENSLHAREKLLEAGLVGEDLTEVLAMIVTEDLTVTLDRAKTFVEKFNDAVKKATEARTGELIDNIPKPKSTKIESKAFKDMTFDERIKLKETDLARYNAEVAKLSSKI